MISLNKHKKYHHHHHRITALPSSHPKISATSGSHSFNAPDPCPGSILPGNPVALRPLILTAPNRACSSAITNVKATLDLPGGISSMYAIRVFSVCYFGRGGEVWNGCSSSVSRMVMTGGCALCWWHSKPIFTSHMPYRIECWFSSGIIHSPKHVCVVQHFGRLAAVVCCGTHPQARRPKVVPACHQRCPRC